MSFDPKDFAGSHCGCRYQQDYRPTLGRDGKKESGSASNDFPSSVSKVCVK